MLAFRSFGGLYHVQRHVDVIRVSVCLRIGVGRMDRYEEGLLHYKGRLWHHGLHTLALQRLVPQRVSVTVAGSDGALDYRGCRLNYVVTPWFLTQLRRVNMLPSRGGLFAIHHLPVPSKTQLWAEELHSDSIGCRSNATSRRTQNSPFSIHFLSIFFPSPSFFVYLSRDEILIFCCCPFSILHKLTLSPSCLTTQSTSSQVRTKVSFSSDPYFQPTAVLTTPPQASVSPS